MLMSKQRFWFKTVAVVTEVVTEAVTGAVILIQVQDIQVQDIQVLAILEDTVVQSLKLNTVAFYLIKLKLKA